MHPHYRSRSAPILINRPIPQEQEVPPTPHSSISPSSSFQEKYLASRSCPSYGPLSMIAIKEDGNCLFRCIAWKVKHNQDYHLLIREEMIDYVSNHSQDMLQGETIETWIKLSEEEHSSIENYIQWLKCPGKFVGYFEMLLACVIYNIQFQIYSKGKLQYTAFINEDAPILKLNYINGCHYNIIP